jgi:hypothetical protein
VETRSADQWFAALDQRRIGAGAGSWVAQVLGVHCEDDGFWIQLSSSEDSFATIVIHLVSKTPMADVLAALEGHSRPSDGRPAIIDLAAWTTRVAASPSGAGLLPSERAH